jgi:hypothetical protein
MTDDASRYVWIFVMKTGANLKSNAQQKHSKSTTKAQQKHSIMEL